MCRSWLAKVLTVSDADLVQSAGLDALMFHRAYTFGVMFLAPVAAVACAVCKDPVATGLVMLVAFVRPAQEDASNRQGCNQSSCWL